MDSFAKYSLGFILGLFCLGAVISLCEHAFGLGGPGPKERGCATMGCAGFLFMALAIWGELGHGCSPSGPGRAAPRGPSGPPAPSVPPNLIR